MMNHTQTFSQLKREQKEAIGLLSIGTFLEYFDLMLYVHMAVILNELFFPKTDPHMASVISAFAFCSTYVMRPFAALLFGWIGDNIGRKATIVITTTSMALSCIVMANVGTYAQIGITASWIVTICRILQGMSSMGEAVGAAIYLTEAIKPPSRYPVVALNLVSSSLGGTAAIGLAALVTSFGPNSWRIAFWLGAIIAVIGVAARTRLRETPDFADAKRHITKIFEKANADKKLLKNDPIYNEKIDLKALAAYFIMESVSPLYFYLNYMYCANILQNSFFFTSEQIIQRNFILSLATVINSSILTLLCYKIHPLKILKVKSFCFIPFMLIMPYLLNITTSSLQILVIQLISCILLCGAFPAYPIIFTYFPIFKRFTSTTLAFALAKAIMYVVTAFGTVYITRYFGHLGLLILIVPLVLSYVVARNYFEKLERANNNYY